MQEELNEIKLNFKMSTNKQVSSPPTSPVASQSASPTVSKKGTGITLRAVGTRDLRLVQRASERSSDSILNTNTNNNNNTTPSSPTSSHPSLPSPTPTPPSDDPFAPAVIAAVTSSDKPPSSSTVVPTWPPTNTDEDGYETAIEKAKKNLQLVKLDFGGMRFTTSVDTLTSGEGDNFFKSLLRGGQIPSYQDADGYYFIDRNGKYFEPILDFLRTGVLYIPSNMSRKLVEELARFLMIDVGQASVTVSQEELLQHVNAMGQNGLQLPCYNLEKLTFSRLNLSGSNFAGSNLRGSSFVRTSLAKANFQDADVSRSDFTFANMQYANLINAKLQHANFSHTCLDYASLRNADLRWSQLSKCTLSSASLSGARLTGARCTDLNISSLYCTKCHHNVRPSDYVLCQQCGETSDVVAYNL